MRVRTRFETAASALAGRGAARYLRMVAATTRWQAEGEDDILAALDGGPVILVMWHSRLLLAPVHMAHRGMRLVAPHDPSPAGRTAAALLRALGHEPVRMSARKANRGGNRMIFERLCPGLSLGITADGPLGPAQVMKPAPLDWARATGAPVFLYAFSTRAQRRLDSWDRLLVPLPFSRGAYGYRRWDVTVPRRPDPQALQALQDRLRAALCDHQAAIDRRIGLPPGP